MAVCCACKQELPEIDFAREEGYEPFQMEGFYNISGPVCHNCRRLIEREWANMTARISLLQADYFERVVKPTLPTPKLLEDF